MKLRNISGADLTCPLVPGEHVEAGATVEVDDDLDVVWSPEHFEQVQDKPARKPAKVEGE